jgi:O-antigen/teichoic acid export membrane protein
VALSIPLLTVSQGLRSVLEAHLKFGVINTINIPLGSLALLGPLLLLPYSNGLVPAVAAVILSRVAGGAIYFWLCLRTVPEMRHGIRLSVGAVRPLLRFGSWMTVSNVIGSLMVYLDRFVIGALISVTATAYYSAPHDLITRLSFVARAFAGVLFPAFATTSRRDPTRIMHLYAKGAKYTFIILFPPIFLAVVFAPELLNFWLGPEFSRASARVLQVLALGVFTNCVANIPFALVQGLGRSDITAKLHLIETPFYLILLWWSVSTFGITGAALAWSLRATADMVLLFIVAKRLAACPMASLVSATTALAAVCVATAILTDTMGPTAKLLLVAGVFVVHFVISWQIALSPEERRQLFLRSGTPQYLQPGE